MSALYKLWQKIIEEENGNWREKYKKHYRNPSLYMWNVRCVGCFEIDYLSKYYVSNLLNSPHCFGANKAIKLKMLHCLNPEAIFVFHWFTAVNFSFQTNPSIKSTKHLRPHHPCVHLLQAHSSNLLANEILKCVVSWGIILRKWL